jgi:MFS family permease
MVQARSISTSFLALTAFVCGGAIMVVEILGARVIGPFFGVGLFVWTSLIAVAMIALAGGYAVGGLLVDRYRRADFLYLAVALAGILVLFVPALKGPVLSASVGLGLRGGAFVSALVLFGPPLFLLGCVSPCVVRLAAPRIEAVGKTVGCFYGLSTVGSVLGTVLTGFVLIASLRVHQIFALVGVSLMALALLYFLSIRRWAVAFALVAAAALVLWLPFPRTAVGATRTLASGTTATLVGVFEGYYGSVRVIDYAFGEKRVREMTIDGLIQGGVDVITGLPTYEYLYFLEFLPRAVRPEGTRCLVLGLGAGIVPRWYEARGVATDVVEIDPNVVEAARRHFGYGGRGNLYVEDARYHLSRPGPTYDYVLIDVFNGDATPSHLITVEAFRTAKARLVPGGVLAMNLHGSLVGRNRMTAAVVRTLGEVFDNVDIYPTFDPQAREHGNIVLVAYDGVPVAVGEDALRGFSVHPLAREGVRHFAQRKFALPRDAVGIVLTDEHNPIDLLDAWLREDVRRQILRSEHSSLLVD